MNEQMYVIIIDDVFYGPVSIIDISAMFKVKKTELSVYHEKVAYQGSNDYLDLYHKHKLHKIVPINKELKE